MARWTWAIILLAVSILSQTACSSISNAGQADQPATMHAPGTGETTDMACVAAKDKPPVCLVNGAWKEYSGLGFSSIQKLIGCSGRIIAATDQGLFVFNGSSWAHQDDEGKFGRVDNVVCRPEGYWVQGPKGIALLYQDGIINIHTVADFLPNSSEDDSTSAGLIITDNDVLYAVFTDAIIYSAKNSTTAFSMDELFADTFPRRVHGIAIGSSDTAWVLADDYLYTFIDSNWESNGIFNFLNKDQFDTGSGIIKWVRNETVPPLALENLEVHRVITTPQKETIIIGTSNRGSISINTREGSWNTFDRFDPDFPLVPFVYEDLGTGIWDVAYDDMSTARKRRWLATTYGLFVTEQIPHSSPVWTSLRMDNVPAFNENLFHTVAVVGAPALPVPNPLPAKGSITGRLINAGGPLQNQTIELCVEPLLVSTPTDSPCSAQPYRKSSTTSSDGIFFFSDLPRGYYVLSTKIAGGWAIIRSNTIDRLLVDQGAPINLGDVVIGMP